MYRKKEIIDKLIQEDSDQRRSKFITFAEANSAQNEIQINNLQKEFDLTDEQLALLQEFSTNPRKHKTIGIHAHEGKVEHITSLPFEYEADFDYRRYFVLPYFDYRVEFFKNLYLLVFAKNSVKLFEVDYGQLQEVDNEVEKIAFMTIENQTNLAHGGDNTLVHAQTAQGETNLAAFLREHNARILIASTAENMALLSADLGAELLADFHLAGNFEDSTDSEILELLHAELESHIAKILKSSYDKIDLSISNETQAKPFIEIVAIANEGRVADMYVGKLGMHDANYENPIAPLGVNYIASIVLKLGGNVHYFPELDFELNDNNIAFRLRY